MANLIRLSQELVVDLDAAIGFKCSNRRVYEIYFAAADLDARSPDLPALPMRVVIRNTAQQDKLYQKLSRISEDCLPSSPAESAQPIWHK